MTMIGISVKTSLADIFLRINAAALFVSPLFPNETP